MVNKKMDFIKNIQQDLGYRKVNKNLIKPLSLAHHNVRGVDPHQTSKFYSHVGGPRKSVTSE